MRTPIADFVKEYAKKSGCRFHMPGHKGQAFLGCEAWDITEIKGADALYEAEGIIAESEANATALFGTQKTLFSTEGSSQCIRAMMHLVVQYQREKEPTGRPYVLAARNVHKTFLSAAALVDFDVVWLYPNQMHSLCSCKVTLESVTEELTRQIKLRGGKKPAALYVTCPDYLGGSIDLKAFAKLCHEWGILLAVDNAHGAYLHFLETPLHPMDLGADICCDSAHKTLSALTGAAYLQIGKNAPKELSEGAKQAMMLYGSTSPSYLTLASLDLCNAYLDGNYRNRLHALVKQLEQLRVALRQEGYAVEQTDPLKLTIQARNGIKLAEKLRTQQIECEYADEDYVVLMLTTENTKEERERLLNLLLQWKKEEEKPEEKKEKRLSPAKGETACSIRKAIFSPQEVKPVEQAIGRICGMPMVACPPAIPIAVPGEIICEEAVVLCKYYGIEKIAVLKEENK